MHNQNKINEFIQPGFKWEKYKHTSVNSIIDFQELIQNNELKELLDRKFIIEAFNNGDYFKAFVLTMMWGGINATRPSKKGDRTTTNFYKSLIEGKESISKKMQNIKKLVNENKLKEAYSSMMPEKENQINGIGESYFTKLFYFIGCNNNLQYKPLIYDKWTKMIHIGLLIEANENIKLQEFYKINDLESKILNPEKTDIIYPRNDKKIDSYLDYIERMNTIAKNNKIDVGNLEAFLFGKQLKGKENKSNENPRVFIKSYVCKNFTFE